MKIIFYLAGGVEPSQADFDLMLDGNLIPHHASQNTGPDIIVILEIDDVGLTDEQTVVMRQMADIGEIVVRIEVS